MADKASVNFASAYKRLQATAKDNPEWFDFANEVLRRTHDGKQLLLDALMGGLKEAFEMGRKNTPPIVEQVAPSEAVEDEAPRTQRITRRAPPAQSPATNTAKRLVRSR